jgi:hypothetical protein
MRKASTQVVHDSGGAFPSTERKVWCWCCEWVGFAIENWQWQWQWYSCQQ